MMSLTGSKNIWKIALVLFLYFSLSFVSSSYWSMGYYSDNWYIEVYSGDYWHTAYEPYTYYQDDWYYYDYPYRVYNSGQYYYYEPGWYSYDSYWRYDPVNTSYYNYYSGNYYYSGGNWYYNPGWTNSYGTYYYTTYYPPRYGDSGVGFTYDYSDKADKSDLVIEESNVTIRAGQKKNIVFYIKNRSEVDLEVNAVYINTHSSDVTKKNLDYPSTITAGRTGEIEFALEADNDAKSDTITAEVRVSGQFIDGTLVQGKKESFYIYLNGTNSNNNSNDYYNSNNDYSDGYAYYVSKDTDTSSWQEVEVDDDSWAQPTTGIVEETEEEDTGNYAYTANPNSVSIYTENLTIQGGDSKSTYIRIKNYSTETFYLETANIEASGLDAQIGDIPSYVSGNSIAYVKLTVKSGVLGEDTIRNALFSIRGYYDSGTDVSKEANIAVYVIGEADSEPSFNMPSRVILDTATAFTLNLDNPGSKKAVVYINAENADVSLGKITVEPNSYAERVIRVSNLGSEKGYVFYKVYYDGAKIFEKVTYLEKEIREEAEEEPEEVEEEPEMRIEMVSYSSEIEFSGGAAEIEIEIRNAAEEAYLFEMSLEGSEEFYADGVTEIIEPGEKKTMVLELKTDEELEEGSYYAYIKVKSGMEEIFKKVKIEVKAEESQDALSAVSAMGMAVLGNSINIGLAIAIVVAIIIIYKALFPTEKEIETWKEYKPQGF